MFFFNKPRMKSHGNARKVYYRGIGWSGLLSRRHSRRALRVSRKYIFHPNHK